MMILSGDPPRSRVLSLLLVVIVTLLALAPFLFPGAKAMNVATKICIFARACGVLRPPARLHRQRVVSPTPYLRHR